MTAFQSVDFVVTPDELEEALSPFTLFISNTHVPTDYTYTPTDVFTESYGRLYAKLCSGEKIHHRNDYKLLSHYSATTDIGSVIFGDEHIYEGKRYKLYKGSGRGFAPYLAPFAFSVCTDNGRISVSTRGSYMVEYTDIIGYQMVFPKLSEKDAALYGITNEKEWQSYNDYMLFKSHIMGTTSAFAFEKDSIAKKTSVRISSAAKKDLPGFDFIGRHGLTVL